MPYWHLIPQPPLEWAGVGQMLHCAALKCAGLLKSASW
jgi:hypothetical protein